MLPLLRYGAATAIVPYCNHTGPAPGTPERPGVIRPAGDGGPIGGGVSDHPIVGRERADYLDHRHRPASRRTTAAEG